MNIKNVVYRSISIDWARVTLPLKAGSPIGLSGIVSNSANAVGIVPQTYTKRPVLDSIYIVTGGDVQLAEVQRAYGSALSADALAAMSGIRFYGADGTPTPDYVRTQYTLPAATTTALGGVKQAAAVAEAAGDAPTAAEFKALLDALKAAGIMATPTT